MAPQVWVGSTLTAIRRSRGLSQVDLARTAGASQPEISRLERGEGGVNPSTVARLAQHLGVPMELFEVAIPEPALKHHLPSRITPTRRKRIEARIALIHLRVERLFDAARTPEWNVLAPSTAGGAEDGRLLALSLRRELELTETAPDLLHLLEAKGIPLIERNLHGLGVSALASWPEDARPVILVHGTAPLAARQLAVAHELGHRLMHERPAATQETDAAEFAMELLLPRDTLANRLTDGVQELQKLATERLIPIDSLARWARRLGLITRTVQDRAISMAAREINRRPLSRPSLIVDVVDRLLNEGHTYSQIADLAHLTVDELHLGYLSGDEDLLPPSRSF